MNNLTTTCKPKGHRIPLALCTLSFLLNFTLPEAGAETIASGTVTNDASHAVQDHIVSASISLDGAGNITLAVRYDVASFVAGKSFTTFYLDFGGDASKKWNALFEMPSYANPFARVLLWDGSKYKVNATKIAFKTLRDGYTCTMPLRSFGSSTPPKSFTVTSQRALSAGSSTPINDKTGVGIISQTAPASTSKANP